MKFSNVSVVRGSLLDTDVEAIVNAANTLMRGGGGIDGMIHQRAGQRMLWELQRVAPRGCESGEVVVTPGFDLPHKWVLHTPGPIWRGGDQGEPEILARCYQNSMAQALSLGARSIGLCSISTGVYGYPLELAAPIAIQSVLPLGDQFEKVVFAMYGEREFSVFHECLERLQPASDDGHL